MFYNRIKEFKKVKSNIFFGFGIFSFVFGGVLIVMIVLFLKCLIFRMFLYVIYVYVVKVKD